LQKRRKDSLAGSMTETPSSHPLVIGLSKRKRLRILIVDDQAVMRKALRQLFEGMEWKVCGEAENGREAIDKALQLKPDLVTLDLSMPVMNGLGAARELRQAFPSASLVMFTLHRTPDIERQAYGAGVDAMVDKAGMEALITCISRLLESRS
jgi:two-component system, chemotaxis family, chemotaxis protein CheY